MIFILINVYSWCPTRFSYQILFVSFSRCHYWKGEWLAQTEHPGSLLRMCHYLKKEHPGSLLCNHYFSVLWFVNQFIFSGFFCMFFFLAVVLSVLRFTASEHSIDILNFLHNGFRLRFIANRWHM